MSAIDEGSAEMPFQMAGTELARSRLSELPAARAQLRVPIDAYEFPDSPHSDRLHDHRYLAELDRQAAIYSACLHDAVVAALGGDTNTCWRHLQGALFAAIVVTRLVDPGRAHSRVGMSSRQATEMAKERGRRLRELVGLPGPDDPNTVELYKLREFRDAMEHVDERLDHISQSPNGSVSDWYLASGVITVRSDNQGPPIAFRAFDATAGRLIMDGRSVAMFQIDKDMHGMRINICEALATIEDQLVGRGTFGNVTLRPYADAESRLGELRAWEGAREVLQTELTAALFSLASRSPKPVLKMWMEVGDERGGS